MASRKQHISRRHFLRSASIGVTAALGLPVLEIMLSGLGRNAQAAIEKPLRFGAFFFPLGVALPFQSEDPASNFDKTWWPTARDGAVAVTGKEHGLKGIGTSTSDFSLAGTSAEALSAYKEYLNFIAGFLHYKKIDGNLSADHAASTASFLTGQPPLSNTSLLNVKSIDQYIADLTQREGAIRSLALASRNIPGGDNKISVKGYNVSLSWKGPSSPQSNIQNPVEVFRQLTTGLETTQSTVTRDPAKLLKQSTIDLVKEDLSGLMGRLGGEDRLKMDEYLTSVRELERRLALSNTPAPVSVPGCPIPAAPSTNPTDLEVHGRLMMDLIAFAFQCDRTRVVSYLLCEELSGYGWPEASHWHSTSHHGRNPAELEKLFKINKKISGLMAYLLGKLKSLRDLDGSTVLDNCLLLHGSGLSDPNVHSTKCLPVVLIGKAGGRVKTNRFQNAGEQQLGNLHLGIAEVFGVKNLTELGHGTSKFSLLG